MPNHAWGLRLPLAESLSGAERYGVPKVDITCRKTLAIATAGHSSMRCGSIFP